MKRNGLIFVTSLVLTLCAGVVLGAVWAKLPTAVGLPTSPNPTTKPTDWIESELHLRPEQKAQMDAIWNDAHQKMAKSFETRHALEKQRDEACKALLSDEQRAAWDKVRADYQSKITEASGPSRDAIFREAEAKTREMLTPEQLVRWDDIKKQRDAHRNQGGPRGMGNRPGSTQRTFGAPGGPPPGNHDRDGPPPGGPPPAP